MAAVIADANARITAARNRDTACLGLGAIRKAQDLGRELQRKSGINLPDVFAPEIFAPVIERFEVLIDMFTMRSDGAKASDRPMDLATMILRAQGFSGAAVARALDPKQAGNSARSTSGRRTAERRGNKFRDELKSQLVTLKRTRCEIVGRGPRLLPTVPAGDNEISGAVPARDDEIIPHLRALNVAYVEEQIAKREDMLAKLARPRLEAQRSPFTVEREGDGGPPVKKRAPRSDT